MTRVLVASLVFALAAACAWAKLPAPAPMTDEQKAKAEEAKAKTADAAKKDAELLAKYQDKTVEKYKKSQGIKTKAGAQSKTKQ
jgi:hypothetical protein